MKRKLTLLIAACLLTTGCGATNQPVSEQSEAAQSTTTMEAKEETTETETTTTVEETTVESTTTITEETKYYDIDVSDACNWLRSDIYGKSLSKIESALNGNEESFDMDFCIANLKIDYAKKEQYSDIIHALDDSIPEQAQLILAWDKSIEQADLLVGMTENGVSDASEFKCDLFKQYSNQLSKTYTDICGVVVPLPTSPQNFVFAE